MKKKNYLYQQGTLRGVMQGIWDGSGRIDELLEYGDFGIGTLNALNGEIIILDGKIYHADKSGIVQRLKGSENTPFAAVVDFCADKQVQISRKMTYEEVKKQILEKISPNLFSAVKIQGTFSNIRSRVFTKQKKLTKNSLKSFSTSLNFR